MKKIFSSIMMAAAALFITSCASDDMTSSEATGEKATVTFSLGLEDGISTRAISDGSGANYLAYAIFNADGTPLADHKKQGEAVTFPVKKSFSLAKDKTYKIAFWAQNSACTAYGVSDDMKVTVDYAGINNDETRDAFFKTVEFTVSGSASIDVELQRALAQINVGVTAADWNAAVSSGVTVENSVAYIKQAASSINLVTGQTSDPVDVTYTANAIPAEDLVVDGETYKWLSMSYILVADGTATGAERATLNDLGFSFNYKDGGAISFESGLTSVPVQRNYRTNIVGKLLTGDVDFNITVDEVYAGDIEYPSTLAQQLEMAAVTGGTVTLTENITLANPLAINSDMVIDLNGKTLTGSLVVNENASLAISGGSVVNTNDSNSGITSNGSLTLDDVVVESARHALRIESGSAVINGGTYKVVPTSAKTLYAVNIGDGGKSATVTIKGGTFIGPKGTVADSGAAVAVKAGSTVNIEGGDFSGGKNNTLSGSGTMTVTGGTFDQNPASYVATGYKVMEKDGLYYVVAEDVNAVVSSNADFATALAAGGTVQVYAGDYTFPASSFSAGTTLVCEEGTVFEGTSSLDIKGSTVVGATFDNPGGRAVTGTVNGTFKNCKFTGSNALRYAYAGETVVFEDCEFSGDVYGVHFDGGDNDVIFRNCVISGFNALGAALTMATFEGCTFKGNGKSGYNGANLWGSAKMINREFTFDGSTADEWVDCIGLDKTYEFENCTINGTSYTKDNYSTFMDYIFSRNDHPSVKINGTDCAF